MPTCLLPKLIFIVIHERLSVIPIIIIRPRPSLVYAEPNMGLALAKFCSHYDYGKLVAVRLILCLGEVYMSHGSYVI